MTVRFVAYKGATFPELDMHTRGQDPRLQDNCASFQREIGGSLKKCKANLTYRVFSNSRTKNW